MSGLNRGLAALFAMLACATLLVACSSDPIISNLRPTDEDRAAAPGVAPAGAVGALVRVGEASRQAGDPAGAIPFFRRAHSLDPFKAEPLVRLGVALNDLGQFNEAAEAFHDALNLEHNNTEALRGLGFALIGLDQPELAIDQFKAAIAIEPDYRSYNGLGVASDHLSEHKAAQDYYAAGLKIFPDNLTLLNNLGLSQILSRDYDAAIGTLVSAAQQPGGGARQRQNLALAYGMAGKDTDAARIARIDLDPGQVQSNLAYYGILRAADDSVLLAAILGVHAPAKLVSAPAPAQVAPQAVPANEPGNGPATEPPKPEAKPSGSVETVPAPVSSAEPSTTETARVAATTPAAGSSHFRAVAAIAIPAHSRPTVVKTATNTVAKADASAPTAAPVTETRAIPIVTASPRAADQAQADQANRQIVEPTSQPATQPQKSEGAASDLSEDSQAANEAAAPTALPVRTAVTASADQAPLARARAAAWSAPAPVTSPSAGTEGPPVWYAAATAAPPTSAGEQESFLDRIFDHLFKSETAPASNVAGTVPAGRPASAIAPTATTVATAADANVAAVEPAAGAQAHSSWLSDIGDFFRARYDAMAMPEHQPIGGGQAASP